MCLGLYVIYSHEFGLNTSICAKHSLLNSLIALVVSVEIFTIP